MQSPKHDGVARIRFSFSEFFDCALKRLIEVRDVIKRTHGIIEHFAIIAGTKVFSQRVE
jgi:hypothetical protein